MQYPSIVKPILILAGVAVLLAAMHFAASFLIPILMALFFATLLSPIYGWLKRRVPGGLALLLTMGVFVIAALFLFWLVGTSLTTLTVTLNSYSDLFSQRQAELTAQTQGINQTAGIEQLLSLFDPETLANALSFFLGAILEIFKNGLLILLVTVFVLVEAPHFYARMGQAFGSDHFLPQNVIELARLTINYFGLRAVVNLVTATATGIMLWIFNIEHAGLWAVLIFFLSFIPYIGAFISMIPPLLLAYAQSGLGLVIIIGLLAVVINSITENIVAPMVMGKGLSISPTVVFLSFIFWIFILGGSGAFIAMPLTMAAILFMSSFAETHGIAAVMITTPERISDDLADAAVSHQPN